MRDPIVDEAFIAGWVARLRADVPDALAILLKGSYARGDAGPHSDVDFDVLTAGGPREDYPAYLVATGAGRLLHVSIAIRDLAGWLASEAEPQPWAFGLATAEAMRLLWATGTAPSDLLARPYLPHPATEPELEDIVEDFMKMKSARRRGDDLALRLAARDLARRLPSVLRLVNPAVVAGTETEALRLILDFPIAPPGYRADMLACLGLDGSATTRDEVYATGRRLLTGVLALVCPLAERLAPPGNPDLALALTDGRLERYITQDDVGSSRGRPMGSRGSRS